MSPDEVQKMLEDAFPDAEITVSDMTGSMDHFDIEVVSPAFAGLTLIKQHRLVQQPLQAALADGRIHAIAIKTCTPEQRKKAQGGGGLNVL
ncbi:MAG: BolA family transcriptional regulator [Candidatus Omnitrophica bacterium]|nr:BolA family transcriptional regulator [Candidatus Omnitrophota bacterium]